MIGIDYQTTWGTFAWWTANWTPDQNGRQLELALRCDARLCCAVMRACVAGQSYFYLPLIAHRRVCTAFFCVYAAPYKIGPTEVVSLVRSHNKCSGRTGGW